MYHSNILFASQTQTGTEGLNHVRINIVPNPLDAIPEPKIPDLVICTSVSPQLPTKPDDTRVNIHIDKATQKSQMSRNSLPFVKQNLEKSSVILPVADYRYFNKRPVYRETTVPLTTVTRKHTTLTFWHGLLFSLIIIVGSILGALAGYGLYKASI